MEFELRLTLTQKQSVYLRDFLYGIINTIFFNRIFRQVVPSNELFLNTVEFPVIEEHNSELNQLINEKLDLIVNSAINSLSLSLSGLSDNNNNNNSSSGILEISNPLLNRQPYRTCSNIKIKFYEKKNLDNTAINCWEIWNLKVIILQSTKSQPEKILSSQSTGGAGIGAVSGAGAGANPDMGTTTAGLSGINATNKVDQEECEKTVELFQDNLLNILDIIDLNKKHIPPITSFDGFPYKIEVSNDGTADDLDPAPGADIGSVYGYDRDYYSSTNLPYNRNMATGNYYVQGEEILKSGFKFIKKMLSD